jgi:hypothetical protein
MVFVRLEPISVNKRSNWVCVGPLASIGHVLLLEGRP